MVMWYEYSKELNIALTPLAIKKIVSRKTNDRSPPRGLLIISDMTGIKKLAVSTGKIS